MSAAGDHLLAELRPGLFGIAYRMLGSVAEAEDVVQEALVRLHRALEAGEPIASPRAYASTVATRLAIDALRSARARREVYVGDWLPEPLITDDVDDPARHAEMADSLSVALLLALERLTPEQRAVLLLRDVFDYGFGEIAEVIGTSEQNARQLAVRARRRVGEHRPRVSTSREQRDELARRFMAAAHDGDVGGLERLLAEDVVLRGDGGGKVPALARSLRGRSRVARTLAAWGRAGRRMDATARPAEVNGQPGMIMLAADGAVIGVMALEIEGGLVQGVSSVVNPDKLRHLGPIADYGAALRERPS
jgi:RNA polymerase sigma-70 factor (TIGR02957 family)